MPAVMGSVARSDDASKSAAVGVFTVGIFVIAAALLQRFAVEAARSLPSWEIIDSAYWGKIDAPGKIEVTTKKPRHAARLFGFQRSEGLFAECCPRRLKSRSLTSSELEHA